MYSRPMLFGMTVLSFAVGLIGGSVLARAGRLERRLAREAAEPRLELPSRPGLPSDQSHGSSTPVDESSLRTLIARQSTEIDRLVDEVAATRLKAEARKSRRDKLAFAKRFFDASLATYRPEHQSVILPEQVFELLRLQDQLDPDMTSYFVERYHQATDVDERRQAWFYVLAAAGTEAAEFLKQWLQDPALSKEDRAFLLGGVSSIQLSDSQSLSKVPVDASLAAIALRLVDSDLEGDRRGAVNLLGKYDSPESQVTLRHLADRDPDPETRGIAVRSLGRIGTRETLAYLRTYPVPSDDKGGWGIRVSLAESIKELSLKFPE